MEINRYELASLSAAEVANLLKRSEIDIEQFQAVVKPIIEAVKTDGDYALCHYNEKFDKATTPADTLKATAADFEQAREQLEPEIKAVIKASARNIKKYHQAQMPEEMWFTKIDPGIMAGEKITPIHSVGLYVPRGKGAFPSVMLMLGIPAMMAGVQKIIVCTPPTPEGGIDAATLFAAEVCGIKEIYKAGGAQAIAAMAYGTASLPKVHKVIGPGNAYVSAAKRLLFGKIDVGTPAGPSESIILADEHANPEICALDLLIEAEHGPDSTALLVTHSRALADQVCARLPVLIADLPEKRQQFCKTVFSNYGGIVLTPNLAASIDFTNDFAPEHLELLVEEPMALQAEIIHAGEILLGPYAPITIGNFSLGVNAILPTGGFAKTFSCVTVFDFLKRTSLGYISKAGYLSIKDNAQAFAEYEGFPCHANAISKRPV